MTRHRARLAALEKQRRDNPPEARRCDKCRDRRSLAWAEVDDNGNVAPGTVDERLPCSCGWRPSLYIEIPTQLPGEPCHAT